MTTTEQPDEPENRARLLRKSRVSFVEDTPLVEEEMPPQEGTPREGEPQPAGTSQPRRSSLRSSVGDVDMARELMALKKENQKLKEKVDKAGQLGSQVERLVGDFEAHEADSATRLERARNSWKEEQGNFNSENLRLRSQMLSTEEHAARDAEDRRAAEREATALREELSKTYSSAGIFNELKEELRKQKRDALESIEELVYVTEEKDAEMRAAQTELKDETDSYVRSTHAEQLMADQQRREAEQLQSQLAKEKAASAKTQTQLEEQLESALAQLQAQKDEAAAQAKAYVDARSTHLEDSQKLKEAGDAAVRKALEDAKARLETEVARHAQEVAGLNRSWDQEVVNHDLEVATLHKTIEDLVTAYEAAKEEIQENANLAVMLDRAARKEVEFTETVHELRVQNAEATDASVESAARHKSETEETEAVRRSLEQAEARIAQLARQETSSVDSEHILHVIQCKGIELPTAAPGETFSFDRPLEKDVKAKALHSLDFVVKGFVQHESEAERLFQLVKAQGAAVHNEALDHFEKHFHNLLSKAEKMDLIDERGVDAIKDMVATAQDSSELRPYTVDHPALELTECDHYNRVVNSVHASDAGVVWDGCSLEAKGDGMIQRWRWARIVAVALHLEHRNLRRTAVRQSRIHQHWARIWSLCHTAIVEAYHKKNMIAALTEFRDISGKWKVERDPLRRGAMNPYTSKCDWQWMLLAALIDQHAISRAHGAAVIMGPAKKTINTLSDDLFLRKWLALAIYLVRTSTFEETTDGWILTYVPLKRVHNKLVEEARALRADVEELVVEASSLLPASVVYRWGHLASRLMVRSQDRSKYDSIMLRKQRNEAAPTWEPPLPLGGRERVEIRQEVVTLRWARLIGVLIHAHRWESSYQRGRREIAIGVRAILSWGRMYHLLTNPIMAGTVTILTLKAGAQREYLCYRLREMDTKISNLFRPAELAWARMAVNLRRLVAGITARCDLIDAVRFMWAQAEGYKNSALLAGKRARLHAAHAITAHQVMSDELQQRTRRGSKSQGVPIAQAQTAPQEKTRAQLERSRALFVQEDATQSGLVTRRPSSYHQAFTNGTAYRSPRALESSGRVANGYTPRTAGRPSSNSPPPDALRVLAPRVLYDRSGRLQKAD